MASDKVESMSEKLNNTKQRLSKLSQKVAENTKTMINNTNESIKSSVAKHKEKREQKAKEKISNTKEGIGQDGLMDDIPPMINLPEFEEIIFLNISISFVRLWELSSGLNSNIASNLFI